MPPGSATCIGRGDANPPILQFDPSGKLLKAFGAGMFGYPHGFTVDRGGNLWVSDVNDSDTVLGMPARNAAGAVLGQEVLKLDQDGKVLMMLGKMGVGGSGTDTFDRPTGVAVAPNGDIFVSDGQQTSRSDSNEDRLTPIDCTGPPRAAFRAAPAASGCPWCNVHGLCLKKYSLKIKFRL